ncbi:MAG: ferrous iron transport protein B [Acidobacteria bacterium]|nr:ferrous iron transport protein B [Acidobacteriota bacterium]
MDKVFAITGNPNSGKTTIFNQLTGLHQKVANYPGVTVEKVAGTVRVNGTQFTVIDLPGTYSIHPRSPEEKIACEILCGLRPDTPRLQGVVCVVDSTTLERNLYLALQIRELGLPMLLVLNMADEMKERGGAIDQQQLAAQLGVPVVSTVGNRGLGVSRIRDFLARQAALDHMPICVGIPSGRPDPPEVRDRYHRARQIVAASQTERLRKPGLQDTLDRIVTHPVLGTALFLAIVIVVFQSIFSWARPLMDGIQVLFLWLSGWVKAHVEVPLLRSLLADGVLAGVGSVLAFLPQIFILFLFIALLEDSGYMARAAFLMDRVMKKIGLQGKSFLPLLSSYACAIPGVMACRTIENKNDRLATMMIAPLMTCSARLPVYTLLIAAFIPQTRVVGNLISLPTLALLGLYGLGFGIAVMVASLLKSSVLKSQATPFILELPPFRLPSARTVFNTIWNRCRFFIRRAGTVILGISLLLWVLASFPNTGDIHSSAAGSIGRVIEPVIRPLGFDWRIGIGLITSFAAREVIVSSLSTIYHVQAGDTGLTLVETVRMQMTPLTAVSLMVFFALACQCISTLAVVKRETNGWRWPLFLFAYMSLLAYVCSLIVYQGGKALGLA